MEFKHFSHVHGLVYHQIPQGTEIQCSGCKFPGSGNVYACWQCSYFLHEQCFQASRSLKHHSHTAHPLTLVPYPTYPSNSFYCNTCNLIGNGFSYCCSECDFDLHIHCALKPNPIPPSIPENPSPVPVYPNYPNFSPQPPIPGPQSQNVNQTANFSPSYLPSAPESVGYYQSIQQTNANPNPLPINSPVPPIPQNFTPNPLPTGPNLPSTTTPPSFPTGYPQPNVQSNPTPSSTAGINFPGASTSSGSPVIPPANPVTNPPLPQVSGPIRISLLSNPLKVKEVKHFSHPHALKQIEIAESAKKICSGCEDELTGSAYTCIESQCYFNLHKSCFELPIEIRHNSHLDHPLKLLAKPPSTYTDNKFACNACLQSGGAFVYNCEMCSFDLHVECVLLPESIIRPDHKHPLKLFYANPVPKTEGQQDDVKFICDVCQEQVHEMAWTYYCHECDFGTHLECAAYEVKRAERTEEEIVAEAEIKLAMLNILMNAALDPASLREAKSASNS
ncbi:OLC1v1001679C1 [Oldenlandia corymbosa var. corymbosa]|uniref:OLC1v1001679C1 n=1 Tax=Oldenlandia corymbosa var. corymbosa TaxID=529605 RepID=A0AAV1D850_OLDCO|nr:OLC1v1001679C1 [Oldenlandia corymbosa var. corymbosa]